MNWMPSMTLRRQASSRRIKRPHKDFWITLISMIPIGAIVTVCLYFNTRIERNQTANEDAMRQTALLMQMVRDQKEYFEQSSNDSKRERDQMENKLDRIEALLEQPRGRGDAR